MKNFNFTTAIVCFFIGVLTFAAWDKMNYVSIPKPQETAPRSIASLSTGQQLIIDRFTESLIAIKSKDQIDKVLGDITQKAAEYPQFVGVQFFAFAGELLPKLKGVLWRMRGVVEDMEIAHTVSLSRLRAFYQMQFAYGPHVKALFHYLTEPVKGVSKFNRPSEVQDFAVNEVKPILSKYLTLALKSLEAKPENHRFQFDRTLLIGVNGNKRLFNQKEAKKEYIKAHTSFIISALASSIGTIDYVALYNVNDLSAISKQLLRQSAINSVKNRFNLKTYIGGKEVIKSLPYVLTQKEVTDVVKKFSSFGTMRKSMVARSKEMLDNSYKMFAIAAEHNLKGYVCTIKYSTMVANGQQIGEKYDCDWSFMEAEGFLEEEYFVVGGGQFLVDPNFLLINHRKKFNSLRDSYRMYHSGGDGSVEIVSDITGAVVKVNMKSLFKGHRDLKIFLPTKFEQSGRFGDIRINNALGDHNADGQWVWNYAYGRPIQWRNDGITFGGLFPEANNNNIYEIMRSVQLTRSLRPLGLLFTSVL